MSVAACLQSLPKTLKIGAYDWSVTLMDDADAFCGQADFAVHRLRLWPANLNSPSHVVSVTLHECFHVVFDVQGLGDLKRGKEDREEQIVLGFETGVVSLFRDNPKLLTWTKRWLR